jgi:phospholipase/carboxylesterase
MSHARVMVPWYATVVPSRPTLLLLLALGACDAPAAPQPAASSPQPPASAGLEAAGVGYVVRYAGAASSDAELPLVVAVHGLGDTPESFVRLLADFPRPARLVFPRGLDPYRGGFSWFPVLGVPDAVVVEGLRAAEARLAASIAELGQRYPTRGKPIVTGFSQGGMLSFALATMHPQAVAVALPLAGWLPPALWPSAATSGAPPIVALHGDADTLLPIGPTRESVRALREHGFSCELVEYPGAGHEVTPAMQRELWRRLVAAIGDGTAQ